MEAGGAGAATVGAQMYAAQGQFFMSLKRSGPRVWLIVVMTAVVLAPARAGLAADPVFTVSGFELVWQRVGPDLPPLSNLWKASAHLGRTARGYTSEIPGQPGVRTDLRSLSRQRSVRMSAGALESLADALETQLEQSGLMGATVHVFLQQVAAGRQTRDIAWFLVNVPVPWTTLNPDIPANLAPLRQLTAATTLVSDIELRWKGTVESLPAPRAFLDGLEIPVSVRGDTVIASPRSRADVGRLRHERGLRWSPKAINTLTTAVEKAAKSLGADVEATVQQHAAPADAGTVVLHYVVTVTTQHLPEETPLPTVSIPPPPESPLESPPESAPETSAETSSDVTPEPAIEPAPPPILEPAPEPAPTPPDVRPSPVTAPTPTITAQDPMVVAAPPAPIEPEVREPLPALRQPPLAPELSGVSIRWSADERDRGNLTDLLELTAVRLRLVDDEVQAGWSNVGEVSNLTRDLADFPPRPWRPSATRAVRHAVEDRLRELGMKAWRVTDEIVTDGDRARLVITLHPPARSADLPPLASKSQEIDDTFYYAVWPFEVMYSLGHSELPAASSFEHLSIELGRDAHGFTPVGEGEPIRTTLAQLNDAGTMLYTPTALLAIERSIVMYLTSQDLMGVTVEPMASQIPSSGPMLGQDLREGGTELTLVATVARVAEIQTSASGDRIAEEDRINNPAHQRIAEGSPLNAAADGGEGDLLRRKEVEEYLHFLSRHPGRDIRWTGSKGSLAGQDSGPVNWATDMAAVDVEAPVAASGYQEDTIGPLPGGVTLDYMISEAKPWMIWYEWGNTGTKAEGYQRQRFGFYTSQLTGNDDILSLQYATSNFSGTNALVGSYEAPLALDGRLRWGINGSWSQYFADQFGVTAIPNAFTGFSWSGGGELRLNVYQDGPLFVDVVGGGRLQHLGIENNILFFTSQEELSLAIPYGMVQMERSGEWSSVRASVGLEGNVLSHDDTTLALVGQVSNTPNLANLWARLNWQGSFATYLEPLINGDAWSDSSTPGSSTLAHELYLEASGQFAFGNRLMPQFQSVAGGPGTNRGYPVSIAAGDNAVNMTGEYRFHVPRAFAPRAQPGMLFGEPFRYAPQRLYGRADWDLMLLGFVDYSWLTRNDAIAFIGETDQTLISAGIGCEFQFKRNLRVRLDWGWALRSLEGGLYDAGHNRLYVQASLSF